MISVLTLVKNRRTHLLSLLEGLSQSRQLPDELLIVHMNEPIDRDLPPLPFAVRQYRLDDEHSALPLARARNLAARLAQGTFLLFLDVDCIPHPEWIGTLIADIAASEGLAMGSVRYLEPAANTTSWTFNGLQDRSRLHPRRPNITQPTPQPTTHYALFWSLNFGLQRTTFERIGGFDESFTGYGGEDTDFAFSAREQAIPFWLSAALTYHQYHAVFRPPLNHLQDIVRNARAFRTKWGRWAMEAWLQAFQREGYIDWQPAADQLEIVRLPSPAEIAACRSEDPFG